MPNFNRYPTSKISQMSQVRAAYTLAGKSEPHRALEISDLLNNAPTAEQVTRRLAKEALSATNAEEFYADALAQVRDAHASDALRNTFKTQLQIHANESMPEIVTQAVKDVGPSVAKIIKELETAAPLLPASDPLDITLNVENGTANAYTATKAALATLAVYASMYVNIPATGVPTGLSHILPVVALPNATVERVTKGLHNLTLNEQNMSDTRQIRALANAAKDDLDTALIAVARGDYPSIALSLATPEEHVRRRTAATTAYSREYAESDSTTLVMR